MFEVIFSIVGYMLCALAVVHAIMDCRENRTQRLLLLLTVFIYGMLLEVVMVIIGTYQYASFDFIMLFGVVPLSISLSWAGIIYSAMVISEQLNLSSWQRVIAASLIALSLDWGMDPIAVELGFWTWAIKGSFFEVPSLNFIGWFFIPMAYSIPYSLNWDKDARRFQLLTMSEIDTHYSLKRKLYTLVVVIPIGIGILYLEGLITRILMVNNLPLPIVIVLIFLTVIIASIFVILKREELKHRAWFDFIPSIILLLIACSYVIFGFLINRPDLGLLLILTGLPLLLSFIFSLQKKG